MHLFHHVQIGTHHDNHTEDFVISKDIGEHRILLATMDGCTMGKESFFASAVIGKLLRKIAQEAYYKEYGSKDVPPLADLQKTVVLQLMAELRQMKATLQLDKYELLATLVMAIVDTQEKTAIALVIGDGLLVVNGEFHDFDQENAPDYLAYHLEEDPATYYQSLNHMSFSAIEDISLSTDGAYTFSKYDINPYSQINEQELLNLLFISQEDHSNERMLLKRMEYIKDEFGLMPTDDLGIVRLILNKEDKPNETVEWKL